MKWTEEMLGHALRGALANADIDGFGDEGAGYDPVRFIASYFMALNSFHNWSALKEHHPTGAYFPVGQLDGDCSAGCGPWPCAAVFEGE